MEIGTTLPAFELLDESGNVRSDAEFRGNPVVIYFYPKDDSPGCTKQACSFRDAFTEFESVNATVIGVSKDDPAQHKLFKEKHRLPFTLLSDPNDNLHTKFGVKPAFFGLLRGRETFVFGADGKLKHKFSSHVNMNAHISEALEALNR